jgi:hypothetical protein
MCKEIMEISLPFVDCSRRQRNTYIYGLYAALLQNDRLEQNCFRIPNLIEVPDDVYGLCSVNTRIPGT